MHASISPRDLLDAARALGSSLAAEASERDRAPSLPHDAFARVRQAGLGALRVPRRLGGAGGSHEDLAHLVILLAEGDPSVAQALLPHFVFVERTLLMATPAQADDFLAQVAQGRLVGGASAERGGKYRGEVATRLRRAGQGYVLDGEKQYCTGAMLGDLLKILAVDEAGEKVLAVVPVGRDGIELRDDWDGMGQRCTASGTASFRGLAVGEHELMRVQRWQTERHHTGATSQLIHCAIEVGIGLAALRDAVDWGRRGIRPVPESGVARGQDDPYVLHTIGDIAATVHAARALVFEAARAVERAAQARYAGQGDIAGLAAEASVLTAQAKIVSTQAALHAGQRLFDVGGAATTLRSHNYDRHWRNARTHTTHDPVAYKFKAVGNYLLNGVAPPVSYAY
ncbi:putative acyl-CoA dehydrogenase [Bordetella hinzii CA90 BAL1384]|uniref:acyl-CoA dehydrogenase family protein n=1 Tax=Bordetella hinzii TaxID=103855 RepID=UPI0004599A30|nr:acyl-CoA dehydrogenase family protein [Bordetella hinzii]KCB39192.1 putative acyl-CoA dehydrogenase [Bordetella hinzii CA90 BAL1384]